MANRVSLDNADKLDIVCKKGDTFKLNLKLKDNNGDPIELATLGYTFLMQVREKNSVTTFPVEIVTKGNVVISSPDAIETQNVNGTQSTNKSFDPITVDDTGNVLITASHSVMKDITPGKYVYDIQSVVAGEYKTILRGAFIVNTDITEV
jgi:hypothetical protein